MFFIVNCTIPNSTMREGIFSLSSFGSSTTHPSLLGFFDLVPPNLILVPSITLVILARNSLPSCPIKILVTASRPGPKSLNTNSNAFIGPPLPSYRLSNSPMFLTFAQTNAASWKAASYVPRPALRKFKFPLETERMDSREPSARVM